MKENDYENLGNAAVGRDNNTHATVTSKNQNRNISITDDIDKELALQSKCNGFTYTITRNDTDITEVNAAGEVMFTVATTKTDVDSINIGLVFVDTNGNGVVDEGETILTTKNGQYDLFDAVSVEGLIPGQSVNIGVEIITNGSGSNKGKDSDIGKSEEITITVSPKTEVDGTPAPADIFANSITTLQGIELYKFQASASCNTIPTSIPNASWTKSVVIAPADQCAFYKLEATNTFTNNTVITNLVLQDILASTLIYQPDSFSSTTSLNSTAATPAISGNTIGGMFSSLAGKETGTIYFSTKISQTGQNKSTP